MFQDRATCGRDKGLLFTANVRRALSLRLNFDLLSSSDVAVCIQLKFSTLRFCSRYVNQSSWKKKWEKRAKFHFSVWLLSSNESTMSVVTKIAKYSSIFFPLSFFYSVLIFWMTLYACRCVLVRLWVVVNWHLRRVQVLEHFVKKNRFKKESFSP